MTGPRGRFVPDLNDPRDFVFLASGTGLAPFMSMIRKLNEDYQSDPVGMKPRRIYVLHGVSVSSHLGYHKELAHIAAETLKNPTRKLAVIYLPTISRPEMDPSWTGLKGRAETLLEPSATSNTGAPGLQDIVKTMLGTSLRPETQVVYVCGHPGTVDGVMRVLLARGFRPDADLKREKYYP